MRFHVVNQPNTQTTKAYSTCAFTQKVRKFCDMMMSLGHDVFLYAGEENEAECTELITIYTKEEQERWGLTKFDHMRELVHLDWDPRKPHWKTTNVRAVRQIRRRKQPHDFVCVISGGSQRLIADALPDLMTVEFGIGYQGTFAKYRVFESYAWMHAIYAGQNPQGVSGARGNFYDMVIPNYFEVDDFPYTAEPDDYYLFIGRLVESKGYAIAMETCEHLGKRLVVAGAGDRPRYGEYVGVVDVETRGQLMSKAKAVFVPTLYLEPFGGVHVEAMLCGTPVITTDWGVFTETVQQGVNGFRCRNMREFCRAAEEIEKLDRLAIRENAIARYSTEVIAHEYQRYFEHLETLWDDGFYTY